MKNIEDIIRAAVEDILRSMTETEIRNMVETWIAEHPDAVADMVADRVRKVAESVLFDLPF